MEQVGMLDAQELEAWANAGEIDTVLCMFTDLQGRFMGKRVMPDFFLHEVLGEEGLHASSTCSRSIWRWNPCPATSTRAGRPARRLPHGPDMSTLRWCPWIEKTAMVICESPAGRVRHADLLRRGHRCTSRSPREIPLRALTRGGVRAHRGRKRHPRARGGSARARKEEQEAILRGGLPDPAGYARIGGRTPRPGSSTLTIRTTGRGGHPAPRPPT